jgi:hypothetical protein
MSSPKRRKDSQEEDEDEESEHASRKEERLGRGARTRAKVLWLFLVCSFERLRLTTGKNPETRQGSYQRLREGGNLTLPIVYVCSCPLYACLC